MECAGGIVCEGVCMQAYEPNTLLLHNFLTTMGVGLPSTAATCLFHPEKKVVVLCGDGGFMLNFRTRFQSFFQLGPKVKKWALKIFIT
jgi:thiamine pyrophosphate-dependent acetolactate synthase large subunit-like protein